MIHLCFQLKGDTFASHYAFHELDLILGFVVMLHNFLKTMKIFFGVQILKKKFNFFDLVS